MKRGKQTIRGLDDYKMFIAEKSNGLTRTGQLLFKARKQTRVGRGAMSIQTQKVFRKLMNDKIIQDDCYYIKHEKGNKRYKCCVEQGNTSGNSFGSFQHDYTEMKVGYNNVLKLVGSGMEFDKNDDLS